MIADNDAQYDFNKARTRARMQGLLRTLSWKHDDLLSWYEVTSIIKPKSETYLGMRTIPVDKIIGSEGRYHDFSAAFLPKRERLRSRWVSVDSAQLNNIILPPISVYSLGGWYFVRDGNHRVSVAKANGIDFIDADVVELDSTIPLEPGISMKEIRRRVVRYERGMFLQQYGSLNLPFGDIVFTTPGAYAELINHILVHKYYINQNMEEEISMEKAAKSWYDNVYSPIVKAIREDHLLADYPGSTEGDMYMWIVKRWDEFKHKGDENMSIKDAVKRVEKENNGLIDRAKRRLLYIWSKVKRN